MADCVFCDPEKIMPRMIASFDGVYIVATLGQITNGGYILLIPANHTPCFGAMEESQIQVVDRIAKKLIRILEDEYQSPVTVFEHGIVGQTIKHAHLHFFPAEIDLGSKAKSDFPKSEIQVVSSLAELRPLYLKRQEPYLLSSTKEGTHSVCWNPPAQPQYFRINTAEMLGVPERADWKEMDPVLDKSLVDDTLKRLIPYFAE